MSTIRLKVFKRNMGRTIDLAVVASAVQSSNLWRAETSIDRLPAMLARHETVPILGWRTFQNLQITCPDKHVSGARDGR